MPKYNHSNTIHSRPTNLCLRQPWIEKALRFPSPIAKDSNPKDDAAYSALLPDEERLSTQSDDTLTQLPKPKPRPLYRFGILLTKVLPHICVLWAFVFLANWSYHTVHPPVPTHRSCSCGGTTVAEAKRQGCKFTPLAIAWLPPHCIDEDLANEFDRAGPKPQGWEYWRDLNATIPMTVKEVGELADYEGEDAVFYTTVEWHITHCMWTWRKHYRSLSLGTVIENRSNGIKHIKHCEGIVRDRAPLLSIGTRAGIELNADLV